MSLLQGEPGSVGPRGENGVGGAPGPKVTMQHAAVASAGSVQSSALSQGNVVHLHFASSSWEFLEGLDPGSWVSGLMGLIRG